MKFIHIVNLTTLLPVLLLLSSCGSQEDDKARALNKKLNALIEKQATGQSADTARLYVIVSRAQQAIETKNSQELSNSVEELAELGDAGVEDLVGNIERPQSIIDRVTAIILLGELGPRANNATATLEAISLSDVNNEVKTAAAEALVKIRGAK